MKSMKYINGNLRGSGGPHAIEITLECLLDVATPNSSWYIVITQLIHDLSSDGGHLGMLKSVSRSPWYPCAYRDSGILVTSWGIILQALNRARDGTIAIHQAGQ